MSTLSVISSFKRRGVEPRLVEDALEALDEVRARELPGRDS